MTECGRDHRPHPAPAPARRTNRREDLLDTNVHPASDPGQTSEESTPSTLICEQMLIYHVSGIPLHSATKTCWWHSTEHTPAGSGLDTKATAETAHRHVHTDDNHMSLPNYSRSLACMSSAQRCLASSEPKTAGGENAYRATQKVSPWLTSRRNGK